MGDFNRRSGIRTEEVPASQQEALTEHQRYRFTRRGDIAFRSVVERAASVEFALSVQVQNDVQSRNVEHFNTISRISLQRTEKTFKAGMFNITSGLLECRRDGRDERAVFRNSAYP